MFTKRSWGSFGTAVVGLGIAIIFNVILVFTVNNYTSITAMIIAITVGMAGLFVIFLGIKICSWDKGEEPEMLWIDPNLDYRFLLTFRGTEQEVKDFSEMEEVLTAYDLGREAWSLKIVPPMGTLFEWKGTYDDKSKTYVTEIAFVCEEGIQRWALHCDYGYLEILNRELKKIIAEKKKASLCYFSRIDGESD